MNHLAGLSLFFEVYREWSEWVTYLDRKYPKKVFLRRELLDFDDAKKLMNDADKWLNAFLTFYSEPGTSYIKGSFQEVFPDSLIQGFSERTISDLNDAYSCIMHHLPTPSAMMSFRVGEQVVRLIYNKVIGSEPGRKTWGKIIHTLKENEKIPSSLAGYLDYLREQRNAAGHPDKRFSLEESERILLQIKGLIEEYEKMT